MSSSDVRDVLSLPDASAASRPAKKARFSNIHPSAPRSNLKGLAREVYSLGGDNPIAIVPQVSQFKKRRLASRKPAARWELRPFRNSAREGDQDFVLKHWRRVEEGATAAATTGADGQLASSEGVKTEGGDAGQDVEGEEKTKEEEAGEVEEEDVRPKKELEDSAFAKFNVKVNIPTYTDDQYAASLESDTWTKHETDYLISLCRDFDLRWPLVWDRYDYTPPTPEPETGTAQADDTDSAPAAAAEATAAEATAATATAAPAATTATTNTTDAGAATSDETTAVVTARLPRTMEELKARYYEIAAKTMALAKPVQYMSQPEFALHELMAHFNPVQEKLRKDYALKTLSRSHEEAREEESLLLEIKRIIARQEKFNEDRRELYARLDYPHAEASTVDISSFKTSAGLYKVLETLTASDKSKKRKSLMAGDGVSPGGQQGAQGGVTQEANRRDSSAAAGSAREAATGAVSATATPVAGNKKGGAAAAAPEKASAQQPAERRKLTEQEEAIYGVSHFDRLTSGPAFRTEKINKLFTHRSISQQTRITNTLTELDVPLRLAMPSANTTAQYEQLLVAINTLLDARKVRDKLEAEIKVEEAKRSELQKQKGVTVKEEVEADQVKDGEGHGEKTERGTGDAAAADPAAADEDGGAPPAAEDAQDTAEQAVTEEADDDVTGEATPADGVTPGSNGANAHKRSASEMSAASDKSAKRHKKS